NSWPSNLRNCTYYPNLGNKEKLLRMYERTEYKILKNRIEILFNIKNKTKPTSNVWLPKISNYLNDFILKTS
ncbi:MAG: hypothetical protein ACTH6J_15895, partial [Pseudoalteromonas sp.]